MNSASSTGERAPVQSFELLELDPFFDENGWRGVRVAVNGVPAAPFQFHKSVHDQFLTEDAWLGYLSRQGSSMIARGLIYGQERPQPLESPDERTQ